jgi:hypothetical protein
MYMPIAWLLSISLAIAGSILKIFFVCVRKDNYIFDNTEIILTSIELSPFSGW